MAVADKKLTWGTNERVGLVAFNGVAEPPSWAQVPKEAWEKGSTLVVAVGVEGVAILAREGVHADYEACEGDILECFASLDQGLHVIENFKLVGGSYVDTACGREWDGPEPDFTSRPPTIEELQTWLQNDWMLPEQR